MHTTDSDTQPTKRKSTSLRGRKGSQLTPGQRIALMSIVDAERGCHVLDKAPASDGYPQVRVGGKLIGAHRYVYFQVYGAIPAGHQVHHRCHQPACVNPDHLELLTKEAHKAAHSRRIRKSKSNTKVTH